CQCRAQPGILQKSPLAPLYKRGGGIFLPWLIAFVQCEGSGLSLLAPSPNWARVYTTRTSPYGVSLPPFLKGDGGGFPAGNSEYDRWKSPLAPLYERGGEIFLPWLIVFVQSEGLSPLS